MRTGREAARSQHAGLSSAARGAQYLENCTPLLAQLSDLPTEAGGRRLARRARIAGRGRTATVARAAGAGLGEWHERHPHVHIDLRTVDFLTVKVQWRRGVDVLVAWAGRAASTSFSGRWRRAD